MKVSLQWLKIHVDLEEPIEEIERVLTAIGLEVEGKVEQGKPYESLVIAKVLECAKHPDSDHLSVTKVFDGKEELQVVCGAPNVAAGQTVCFARIGTELPMADGTKLTIKKAKIRGVESFGMICAEDEIGLGKSHAGIMVLDNDLQAGIMVTALGWYDTVLELNVTPNRPDALSHRGVARELAAAFHKELKPIEFTFDTSSTQVQSRKQLQVEDGCGCTRYVGRIIENVKIGPSPDWMRRLLESIGIASINNVVDVTNFVLMDLGQPLHSFDMAKLKANTITVRRARQGESLETIDHRKHELRESDLIICDGDIPACVAGVMGGVESEIVDQTTEVFLESAWFAPTIVRKQSKRLGLSTDSSYRFERHIDPFMQQFANDYACWLIATVAGGTVLEDRLEYSHESHQQEPRLLSMRPSRVRTLLGMHLSADRMRAHLNSIGLVEQGPCAAAPEAEPESMTFAIPGFRPDLEREVDLVEEIARLEGYDAVPGILPAFTIEANPLPPMEVLGRKIRHSLAAMGLHECLSLRFDSASAITSVFGPKDPLDRRTNPIALLNPLSEDLGMLPVSMIPNLLKAVVNNIKNRESSIRLFEVGKGQFEGYQETNLLGVVLAGQWPIHSLAEKTPNVSFADSNGVLLKLGKRLGLLLENRIMPSSQSWLHPHAQAAVFANDVLLGYCGEIHPSVLQAFDIQVPVMAFELDLDALVELAGSRRQFQMFSRQVPTTRDVSIETDERVTNAEIRALFTNLASKLMVDVQLKSLYQGDKIAAGSKNLLYQCTYQAEDRTLTDEEVNKVHEKLRTKLLETGKITLR